MFILYALGAGIVVGLLAGGRLERLGRIHIAWAPLAVVGLVVQLLLFSTPLGDAIGQAGPLVYMGSTGMVLAVVVRNVRLPGLALVAAGALANLAAIVANGGYMPVSASALESAGLSASESYSNSRVLAEPALRPLTDIFAVPAGIPLANVFSVGDVLIALGLAIVVVAALRRPAGGIGSSI